MNERKPQPWLVAASLSAPGSYLYGEPIENFTREELIGAVRLLTLQAQQTSRQHVHELNVLAGVG